MAKFQFATFQSDIELPFYTSLASHKINHDKLDDSARRVLGLYEINQNDTEETSCRMQLHANALTVDESVCPREEQLVEPMLMPPIEYRQGTTEPKG